MRKEVISILEDELNMKDFFAFAIDNISKYGDTDIFPFPIENHIFYDKKEETIKLFHCL